MTVYDIELGQGDSDNVGVVLKENGIGANLTGGTVIFSMVNTAGDEHNIECLADAVINGVTVAKANGGVTIPFTSTHTVNACLFRGKFIVTILELQTTFPSGKKYVTVRVWEGI